MKVRKRCAGEDQRIPRAAEPANARARTYVHRPDKEKWEGKRGHFLVISRSIALLVR